MFRLVLILLALNGFTCSIPLSFADLIFNNSEIKDKIQSGVSDYHFAFQFENKTKNAVKISDVVSSCDCVNLKFDKKEYQPNEAGKIKGVFAIGERVGRQEKSFIVVTDEAENSKYELKLVLEIVEPVTIRPKLLLWKSGDRSEKQISVMYSEEYEFSKIEYDSKLFQIKNEIPKSNQITVTPAPNCPKGRHSIKLFSKRKSDGTEHSAMIYLILN